MLIRAGSLGVSVGVRVWEQRWLVAGEEAFEQQRRGNLVDEVFAVDRLAVAPACGAGAVSGGIQQGVGLKRGQPLVEQMVCKRGMLLAHGGGKGQGLGGLGAGRAVGVERIADHDSRDLVLANEPGYGLQVGPERGAMQREERLGRKTQRISYGKTDAAVADVERENARGSLHEDQCTEPEPCP